MKIDHIKFVPKLLGYLGLLPIVISTALIFFDHHHSMVWRNLLVSYAALILSFLGALHWAFSMEMKDLSVKKRSAMMVWSVMPSLIAWIALLIPQIYGMLVLSGCFVLAFWMDANLAKSAHLPTWYIPLRFRLTFVVVFCLMATAYLFKTVLINV